MSPHGGAGAIVPMWPENNYFDEAGDAV